MLGWSRAASSRGSCSRSSKSPLWRCGTLIATFLSIQASLARKTVPKPPEPRLERIWYFPTACPSRNIEVARSIARGLAAVRAQRAHATDRLHGRRARRACAARRVARSSIPRAARSARSAPRPCCATRTWRGPIARRPGRGDPATRATTLGVAARRHRACATRASDRGREAFAARLPGAARATRA